MKKNTIMALVIMALLSACSNPFVNDILPEKEDASEPYDPSDPSVLTIRIAVSGNVAGDSINASPETGKAGDEITLNYTVANIHVNNRLVFSGTTAAIAHVDGVGSGTRMYTIAEEDSIGGVITINAAFTHTNLQLNTIAFAAPPIETKIYGDAPFTKPFATAGLGNGTITYSSSDTGMAAVDSNGEVTIKKVGTATITAAKAADTKYEQASASYTLVVTPLQLTIAEPTVTTTKTYNGNTTAAVTAVGELINKKSGDTVNVSAVANYNSANVAEANQITVVFTISGADSGNYIEPTDYITSGSITKAAGGTVNTNPTAVSITANSITSNVVTPPSGQTVEYAISTAASPTPTIGWQDGLVFSELNSNTDYYIFARAKGDDNYLAGEPKVSSKITTDKTTITININITGDESGDSLTVSHNSGKAGEVITLNYNLANTNANNRLVFSGTTAVIGDVNTVGSGTRTYTIDEEDAANGVININATFTHADLQLNTIAFGNTNNEERIYGDSAFTKAISNTGSGSGAITYSSSDTTIATVNNSGAVTILKVGTATITATKAADATFAQATASYTLTVTKLQLTIANPNVTATKTYNGNTTAAVIAGALTNIVGSDVVTVSAVANYNSANVADANLITVVYTISGANADNYIKPVNYTVAGTITKAAGAAVSGSPTMNSKTANSITVNPVTVTSPNAGNQTVEYAIATTTTAPSTGWQDGYTFSGLNSNTNYYVFARTKENANYNAGTAQISAQIKTDLMADSIAFSNPLNESVAFAAAFTKTLSNTGSGTGAITYSSSDTTVATVNNSGVVTILKVGTTTITATKAADATFAQATASYTLTITKAAGGTVNAPTVDSKTANSITIIAVTPPVSGQTVEYAISTLTTAPSTGWQDGLTFSGLTANTGYYVFARAKENANYNAGAAQRSTQITTDSGTSAVTTVINFEADAVNKTYEFTRGDNDPSSVKVVTDPIRSGQKSLQITTNDGNSSKGYNQAAIIPVYLPYAIENYQSFSFKFSLVSGNTGTNLNTKSIQVYVAKNTTTFVKWGFGNDSSAGNQFAANLLGATPAVNFDDSYKNKWTDYSFTITNPGTAIKDLSGNIFIAIGINCQNNAVYLLDDITFTPKSNFVPPPPPPEIPSRPLTPPSTGAVTSGTYRNMFKEFGYTDAEVTAKVNTAWNKLFVSGTADEKIYVETGSDMAYIYTADTTDVRSEGMSYGMMMCVQMDDQVRFNKLWKWAKTYMYNPTTNAGNNNRGYFAWQCNTNGSRKDQSPAPDGEFYFTTALLFASARWGDGTGDFNYGQYARQILYDMIHRTPNGTVDPYSAPEMFNKTNYMPVFVPYGQSASHTDPSYHLPAFYEVWALELENDWKNNKLYGIWSSQADLKTDVDFYKQAAATSRTFFHNTTNATTGLGPDYAEFSGTPTGGNHADFRFDAWRIAMNIGMDYAWWADDDWQKTFANRIQAFFVSKGVNSYGNQWTLSGNQLDADHSPGLVGCNAVASLAATHENAWKFIDDFWNISMTTGTYRYYDGCLYMMSMLHLSGNFKAYLSTNTTPVPNSSISPTTATFDKKTGVTANADITVNMTLNGNTLTSIKNGATTLTSGNYTLIGDSKVTINKSYLTTLAVGTTTLTFTFSAGMTRDLVITVVDTTNSSISPTTAIFDKRNDLQSDITVTMTLNGNTLTNISNGGTNLTKGTHYTESGSTVIIKKSYLETLAVGTTTLTFTFNAGAASNLVITVKESPQGGGTGTKYDFTNDTFPAGYPKYSSGDISSTITGGVLVVTKINSYSTPKITLPFSLGAQTLANYSGIKINVKGVSGDFGNKVMYAAVGSTNLGSVNNAPIPNGSFGDVTIPITSGGSNTGDIEISFWLNNTQAYVIEIKSIELIPKP